MENADVKNVSEIQVQKKSVAWNGRSIVPSGATIHPALKTRKEKSKMLYPSASAIPPLPNFADEQ